MKQKINITNYDFFLIIQTAFIGDVALSLFLAEEIKLRNPNAKITLVTTKQSVELANCSMSINEVIIFDKRDKNKGINGIVKLAKQINSSQNYDIIFNLHRSFRSGFLTKLINAKYKIGFAINSLSFFLTHKVEYLKNCHEVERNHNLLSIFENHTNYNYNNGLSIKLKADDLNFVKEMPLNYEKKIIILAIGSVWQTKRWKLEYFIQLAQMLKQHGNNVILTGSSAETAECDKVAIESGAVSIAGKTTIPQTMAIMQKASLVITNDSAPTHFASILNVPTVTIYGPTSPIFGFSPLAHHSIIIEDTHLFCRPCSIHGQRLCPRKTHECMKNLTPQTIFSIIQQYL